MFVVSSGLHGFLLAPQCWLAMIKPYYIRGFLKDLSSIVIENPCTQVSALLNGYGILVSTGDVGTSWDSAV